VVEDYEIVFFSLQSSAFAPVLPPSPQRAVTHPHFTGTAIEGQDAEGEKHAKVYENCPQLQEQPTRTKE
jgi:hypothetical protein